MAVGGGGATGSHFPTTASEVETGGTKRQGGVWGGFYRQPGLPAGLKEAQPSLSCRGQVALAWQRLATHGAGVSADEDGRDAPGKMRGAINVPGVGGYNALAREVNLVRVREIKVRWPHDRERAWRDGTKLDEGLGELGEDGRW